MKTKFLQDLGLDKEIIDKIMAENGKDVENAKGNAVDLQSKLEATEKQLNTANETIKLRDEQLETIKNSPDNPETLKQTIVDLQESNKKAAEEHQKEIYNLKVSNALEKALTSAKAKNTKAVQALLELNDVELNEDGTVKGLDDKLNALKKSDAYLFEEENTQTKIKGAEPTIIGNPNPTVKKDAEKSYEDFLAEVTEQE